MAVHRIYFDPGMFGFGRLASYEYFVHLRKALEHELGRDGDQVESYVADVQPTASIRRRAGRLAELIAQTCDADDPAGGPIHLVGHSTGGLDARLVASPSVALPVPPGTMRWIPRLASVSTLSTPHYGTPLAGFFATVSGQRMLYALSALTFIALSLGAPPLAAASALVVALGRIDRALGIELQVLDRATDALLKVLGDARSGEVRSYLSAIKDDQAALIQLTPEAMDLFQAGIENRPGVLYQSTASMAPPPSPSGWAKTILRPWVTVSHAIFTALYAVTARLDERYPCAAHHAGDENEALLERVFGRAPGARANDGVVPLRSQIWGKIVWAGYADHLDVLGHFHGGKGAPQHNDWLSSGSSFDVAGFDALTRALASGMRAASPPAP
jgi:triacylglycerol lipase